MKNKLKQLILYIADKSKDDPAFGATKLNKILFTVDFYYYGFTGKSITSTDYIHLDNGPVPEKMAIILQELVDEDKIEIQETSFFGFQQKRVVPKTNYNLSVFTKDEIEFVDQVIDTLSKWNGSELSRWTHSLIPWLVTSNKEKIPYHFIFVLDKLPVEADGLTWAKKELRAIRRVRTREAA
jgi:uncharacterized phage-associated protein